MRTRGSVRFDPYYKLEVWDERWLAWTPIQKAHPTSAAAAAAAPTGTRWRVLEVTTHGKRLLPA